MSDVSEFWTFSCPNPTDSRALTRLIRHAQGSITAFTLFLPLFVLLILSCGHVVNAEVAKGFRPQVLVLVLGGFGPSEQCSINYDSVVALSKAQSDLDTIASAGKWQVRDAKGETKSSGGPKPALTTSISFSAKGMIGYADGTLPLESYLIGLKRYKYIEVDYITPSSFVFHGLKDFEDRFVKIQMSQSGSAYRYRIVVKDAEFSKLDIPLRQPKRPKVEEPHGSGVGRIIVALGLAIAAALGVYLVMAYVSKRR